MPTVQKWGNSLAIRLPKSVAEQAALRDGTEVDFDTSGGLLTIRPKRGRKYTLAELLARAKGPCPHRDMDREPPVGREVL